MLFAEREYELEGTDHKLVLQIEEPHMEDGNWVCEHRLIGLDPDYAETSKSFGVDKLQALTSALFRISVDLECLSQDSDQQVTWLGDSRLGLL